MTYVFVQLSCVIALSSNFFLQNHLDLNQVIYSADRGPEKKYLIFILVVGEEDIVDFDQLYALREYMEA